MAKEIEQAQNSAVLLRGRADRGRECGTEEGSADRGGGDLCSWPGEIGGSYLGVGFSGRVEDLGAFGGGLWREVVGRFFALSVELLLVGRLGLDLAGEDISNLVILLVFLGCIMYISKCVGVKWAYGLCIPISRFCLMSSRPGFLPLWLLAQLFSHVLSSARNSRDSPSYLALISLSIFYVGHESFVVW